MRLLVLLLCSVYAFAGQSLVLDGTRNITCANISDASDVRIEFRLQNYGSASGTGTPLNTQCLDITFFAYSNGEMEVYDRVGNVLIRFASSTRTDILVRVQRNISGGRTDVEVWDYDGTDYEFDSRTGLTFATAYTTADGSLNAFAKGAGGNVELPFFRAYTTLVALGSKPPTTADVGDYLDWKLDGNGNDASGNSRTVDVTGATFETTSNQGVYAFPKTGNSTSWSDAIPLRAGYASTLRGSDSYSLADADDAVTCIWQQLPHTGSSYTSRASFDDRASCTPSLTGLVFGPYKFRLIVVDAESQTASADLSTGAVAYDSNGIVIYPDERLETILGPAKVLGYPDANWEWFDARHVANFQDIAYRYEVLGGQWRREWDSASVNGVPRNGTVYTGAPTGSYVRDIYGVGTNFLEVFCGGRVGPALPTFTSAFIAPHLPPHGSGGAPRQYARGVEECISDTHLRLTEFWAWDISASQGGEIASPGVSWGTMDMAAHVEGTGTAYVANGSNKVYGAGSNLSVICDGGTAPDAGSTIILVDTAASHRIGVTSCESDTEITLASTFTGTTISSPGVTWYFEDQDLSPGDWLGGGTASFINFYDNALAHCALYFRSGWADAWTACKWMADSWYRSPNAPPGSSGPGRDLAAVGTLLTYILDPANHTYNPWVWYEALNTTGTCRLPNAFVQDLREDVYCLQLQAMQALYDPDETRRNAAKARVATFYTNLWSTQRPDGNYVNQDWGGDTARVATVSNGSATVTKYSGTDFTADYCGVASTFYSTGTISISTVDDVTVTLTGGDWTGQGGKRIFLRGTKGGQPWSQANQIHGSPAPGASGGTLVYKWLGDDSSVTAYRIQSAVVGSYADAYMFGMAHVDSSNAFLTPYTIDEDNWYWCTVDSGTQLTLDKPYTGDTTSGNIYRRLGGSFPGRGSQPFMHGIASWAFDFAAKAMDGYDNAKRDGYWTLASNTNEYLTDYAQAPALKGLPYFTHYAHCVDDAQDSPQFSCNEYASDTRLMRDFKVETNSGLAREYLRTEDAALATKVDNWFAAQFSASGYDAPVAGDGTVVYLVSESQPPATKFYGQTYGMGGGHTWPASRQGGPAAAVNRTINVGVNLASVTNAAKIRITITQPTGVTATNTCEASTCTVTGDFRAGAASMALEYLSAGDAVLASSTVSTIVQ